MNSYEEKIIQSIDKKNKLERVNHLLKDLSNKMEEMTPIQKQKCHKHFEENFENTLGKFFS